MDVERTCEGLSDCSGVWSAFEVVVFLSTAKYATIPRVCDEFQILRRPKKMHSKLVVDRGRIPVVDLVKTSYKNPHISLAQMLKSIPSECTLA